MEGNISKKIESGGIWLELSASRIGKDLLLCLKGGDEPHLGCVVLAEPRPSLQDAQKKSVTSSVINRVGHKDELLCRELAEQLAAICGCTVVCTGGVHVDNAITEQIEWIRKQVRILGEKMLTELGSVSW